MCSQMRECLSFSLEGWLVCLAVVGPENTEVHLFLSMGFPVVPLEDLWPNDRWGGSHGQDLLSLRLLKAAVSSVFPNLIYCCNLSSYFLVSRVFFLFLFQGFILDNLLRVFLSWDKQSQTRWKWKDSYSHSKQQRPRKIVCSFFLGIGSLFRIHSFSDS